MKQSFEEIYEEIKNTYGDDIEKESKNLNEARKGLVKSYFKSIPFWVILCIYIFWFVIGIIFAALSGTYAGLTVATLMTIAISIPSLLMHAAFIEFIAGIIYYVVKSSKIKNELNNKYKYLVFDKMLGNFYDGLRLVNNQERMNYSSFDWKSIYNKYFKIEAYNRTRVGDMFVAKKDDKVKLQGTEITLKYETRDSKGHTHSRTVFKGLVCELNLDKNTNCEIQVNRNKIKTGKGFLGSKVIKEKYKNKIEMDSHEFEEKFEVFATDGVKVMQILTADIMQDLINLYDKTNFDFAIINNKLYFKINTPELFELDTFNLIRTSSGSEADRLKMNLKSNYDIVDNAFTIINKIEGLINERF